MRQVPLLLWLLLLILGITASYSVSASRFSLEDVEREVSSEAITSVDVNDPVYKLIPDPQDPKMFLPLKCSACGAVVEEAVLLMRHVILRYVDRRMKAAKKGINTTNDKLPHEYETIDAFENLCHKVGVDYGLEMKSNRVPSFFFTKSGESNRVHGDWMPFFLSSTCEELLDDVEERLTSVIFAAAAYTAEKIPVSNVDFLQQIALGARIAICTRWPRSAGGCDPRGLPLDPNAEAAGDL